MFFPCKYSIPNAASIAMMSLLRRSIVLSNYIMASGILFSMNSLYKLEHTVKITDSIHFI